MGTIDKMLFEDDLHLEDIDISAITQKMYELLEENIVLNITKKKCDLKEMNRGSDDKYTQIDLSHPISGKFTFNEGLFQDIYARYLSYYNGSYLEKILIVPHKYSGILGKPEFDVEITLPVLYFYSKKGRRFFHKSDDYDYLQSFFEQIKKLNETEAVQFMIALNCIFPQDTLSATFDKNYVNISFFVDAFYKDSYPLTNEENEQLSSEVIKLLPKKYNFNVLEENINSNPYYQLVIGTNFSEKITKRNLLDLHRQAVKVSSLYQTVVSYARSLYPNKDDDQNFEEQLQLVSENSQNLNGKYKQTAKYLINEINERKKNALNETINTIKEQISTNQKFYDSFIQTL